jgi:hypothetical protein
MGATPGDLDALGDAADLHRDVDARVLARLQPDEIGLVGLEARGLGAQLVRADGQGGDGVQPGIVAPAGIGHLGRLVGRDQLDLGQRIPVLADHRPGEAGELGLSEEGYGQQHHERHHDCRSQRLRSHRFTSRKGWGCPVS